MTIEFNLIDHFNTGRGYAEAGQRIAVFEVLYNGLRVAFYMKDLDRGLDYYFASTRGQAKPYLREYIMSAYDHGASLMLYFQDWAKEPGFSDKQYEAEKIAATLVYERM